MSKDTAQLTHSERRTYQSLRDRGFSHEDALSDALDGVQLDTLRANNTRKRKPVERRLKRLVPARVIPRWNPFVEEEDWFTPEGYDDGPDQGVHRYDGEGVFG